MVTKCLGEVPPYHIGLTIEDFFVSLSLLSHYFIILIEYSRAQKGTQASHL